MIKSEKYSSELNKVKQYLTRFSKQNRVSNVLLFRDYLNKLDLWKQKLGFDSDRIYLGKGRSFHNLFLKISANWVNEIKNQDEFNNDLLNLIDVELKGGRFYDDLFIYLFIYWELCKDFKEIKEHDLPNPYEPLIKIIMRSEYIYTQNGNIQIDNITINNLEKYNNYHLPSLEFDFLDYIDEMSEKNKVIPNQEKTNQLWEEYSKQKHN